MRVFLRVELKKKKKNVSPEQKRNYRLFSESRLESLSIEEPTTAMRSKWRERRGEREEGERKCRRMFSQRRKHSLLPEKHHVEKKNNVEEHDSSRRENRRDNRIFASEITFPEMFQNTR